MELFVLFNLKIETILSDYTPIYLDLIENKALKQRTIMGA